MVCIATDGDTISLVSHSRRPSWDDMAANLLKRHFAVAAPNTWWIGDITTVPTVEVRPSGRHCAASRDWAACADRS